MLSDSARRPVHVTPLPAALLRRAGMMMGMMETATTGMIGIGFTVRVRGQQ